MDIGYYINRVLPRKIKVRTDGKTASMKESSGTYSKEKFLEEVYMTEEEFDTLASLLRNKKNIILQGAPGVGKTFAAKRLAYAIMGKKDDERIEFISFIRTIPMRILLWDISHRVKVLNYSMVFSMAFARRQPISLISHFSLL